MTQHSPVTTCVQTFIMVLYAAIAAKETLYLGIKFQYIGIRKKKKMLCVYT